MVGWSADGMMGDSLLELHISAPHLISILWKMTFLVEDPFMDLDDLKV